MTDCVFAAAIYARGQSVVQYGPRWRHCFPSPAWTSTEDHDGVTNSRVVALSDRKWTTCHLIGEGGRSPGVADRVQSPPGTVAGDAADGVPQRPPVVLLRRSGRLRRVEDLDRTGEAGHRLVRDPQTLTEGHELVETSGEHRCHRGIDGVLL